MPQEPIRLVTLQQEQWLRQKEVEIITQAGGWLFDKDSRVQALREAIRSLEDINTNLTFWEDRLRGRGKPNDIMQADCQGRLSNNSHLLRLFLLNQLADLVL